MGSTKELQTINRYQTSIETMEKRVKKFTVNEDGDIGAGTRGGRQPVKTPPEVQSARAKKRAANRQKKNAELARLREMEKKAKEDG